MLRAREFLHKMEFPVQDGYDLISSTQTFDDGGQYRIEIPSVEGAATMEAVITEAKKLGVKVNRVSQGSGIMLLSDKEIADMVEMGRQESIEVCLFIGPRMNFDIGGSAYSDSGNLLGWRHSGMDQLAYALEDVFRAVDLGIRSLLIADEGLLWLIDQAKMNGDLPKELVLKVSALMSPPNPVTGKIMQELGGTTLNIPGDLTLPKIAAFREALFAPLDLYIESPDNLGGFLRYYELPEIVRIAAPVYLKFGLRNAANIYPSGVHLEAVSVSQAKEKVHRAAVGIETLKRYAETVQSTSITYAL
ncbi:hypothetical protein [Alkalicoccus daliensis]|uniref:Peptidase family U32 n=1 Tax=Alkalicoccus daliensis TaxID=745820 RepID=A0A1H0FWW2_9BACI|nr:hypothetical protein [Alkalicoccus daliensis]SDN98969.1 hypothetical protein SAMN04488053_105124 [Alkalicoccus daliensis]